MKQPVAVIGAGAFVPGFAGLEGWSLGKFDPEYQTPKASLVPARQRRRASLLSKALSDAYGEALEASSVKPEEVASVFGSALGEAATMIGLLDQMWSETAMLSPMKFATSVHNAASGMVSIATENRGFTTSLGADFDTPAMSLMEGLGLVLAEQRPVIICCGDESPPSELVPDGAAWSLMAAAIVLAPLEDAPAQAPRLIDVGMAPATLAPFSSGKIASSEIASGALSEDQQTLGRNPNIGLLDLVTAIAQKQDGVIALDRGAGRGFTVRIESQGS